MSADLFDKLRNLEAGYDRKFALQFMADEVWAALEGAEKADLEAHLRLAGAQAGAAALKNRAETAKAEVARLTARLAAQKAVHREMVEQAEAEVARLTTRLTAVERALKDELAEWNPEERPTLMAENRRLTEELEATERLAEAYRQELSWYEAENARLIAALEKIVNPPEVLYGYANDLVRIVRDALAASFPKPAKSKVIDPFGDWCKKQKESDGLSSD